MERWGGRGSNSIFSSSASSAPSALFHWLLFALKAYEKKSENVGYNKAALIDVKLG